MAKCSTEGCDKKVYAKGLCQLCYMKQRRIDLAKKRPVRTYVTRHCQIEGCMEKHHAKGYCEIHYHRYSQEQRFKKAQEQRICVTCFYLDKVSDEIEKCTCLCNHVRPKQFMEQYKSTEYCRYWKKKAIKKSTVQPDKYIYLVMEQHGEYETVHSAWNSRNNAEDECIKLNETGDFDYLVMNMRIRIKPTPYRKKTTK